MKPVRFSAHSLDSMEKRGADRKEVEETIIKGNKSPAKKGRIQFEHTIQYGKAWGNKTYAMKKIAVILVEEEDFFEVVTVYTFYF